MGERPRNRQGKGDVLFSCLRGPLACSLFLLVMLNGMHAGAADSPVSRVIDIPRYEAEQVIGDWFSQAGYLTTRTEAADSVRLSAVRKTWRWEVLLKHHSPVASEVTVESCPPGRADDLWKYLAGYLKGYATNRTEGIRKGGVLRDIPEVVSSKMDLVVCIRAASGSRPTQLTGFVVDASGLILCTAHTLQKPKNIEIILADGSSLEGRLVKIDFARDLAIIDCSHAFGAAVAMGKTDAVPDMGQRVYSIGCPLDNRGTVASGYIDGPPAIVNSQPLLQVRMEVEPGSSGSPVFDASGRLIAVVKGRLKGSNISGLLIPMDTIISFVKEK